MDFRLEILKFMIKRLLNKPAPKTYTTSLPEEQQKSYDFLMLNAEHPEYGHIFLKSYDEKSGEIKFIWWPDGSTGEKIKEESCQISELSPPNVSVRQRYRTWDIEYPNFEQAYFHDLFKFPWIRWYIQKFRNRLLKTITPDERMTILKKILELHYEEKRITVNELLILLHGSAIRLSGERYKHQSHLSLIIASLKASGDVEYDNDDAMYFFGEGEIKPTPIAVTSISEFNESSKRHADSIKLARSQLFLGWGMLLIALSTLAKEILFSNN